jgi:hypothetical protein
MSNIISSCVACMAADLHLYFLFTTGIAVLFHELREYIYILASFSQFEWIDMDQSITTV